MVISLSKSDLMSRIIEIDNDLINQGVEPHKRRIRVHSVIAKQLWFVYELGEKNEVLDAVDELHSQIVKEHHPPIASQCIGVFMFRDIFHRVSVPVVFGERAPKPIDCILDITPVQRSMLLQDEVAHHKLKEQFHDLLCFACILNSINKNNQYPRAAEYWMISKSHLQVVSGALVSALDKNGIVQNSFLAVELLLKGALIASGWKDKEVKTLKHSLPRMVEKVCSIFPDVNKDLLNSVAKRMPDYVKNRYNSENYSRIQLGEFAMDTQSVAGAILRQFSDNTTSCCILPLREL